MQKAFTLIELLVVVLIIGILAAVAVLQYHRVVLKTRFSSFLPLVRSMIEAQERYYLANGEYALNLNMLDVQMPPTCSPVSPYQSMGNMWSCGDYWYLDNRGAYDKAVGIFTVYYCSNGKSAVYAQCDGVISLSFWLAHYKDASLAGKIGCYEGDSYRGFCKTFKGTLF